MIVQWLLTDSYQSLVCRKTVPSVLFEQASLRSKRALGGARCTRDYKRMMVLRLTQPCCRYENYARKCYVRGSKTD